MIEISAGLSSIDHAPESVEAEVIQNVRRILSTRKGTVPLDRQFGISWDMLDRPLPVAKALMIAAAVEVVQEYEPRAKVMGVSFKDSDGMEGILLPTVSIKNDGEAKTTSFPPGSRNLVVSESSLISGSSDEVHVPAP